MNQNGMNQNGFFQGIWKGIRLLLIWQICNVLFLVAIVLLLAIAETTISPRETADIPSCETLDGKQDRKKGIILEIPITGVIARSEEMPAFGQPAGSYELVLRDLKSAMEDKSVKAVLIRVQSPGGTISAADHLHARLKEFKAGKKIPVFAFYEGEAASGGVYATVSSDRIIAEPTCITGSVGVILGTTHIKDLFDKLGVKSQVYRSADYKDMGSMFRNPTEDEKKLFQDMVDALYQRFVEVVLEGRAEKVAREKLLAMKSSFYLADKAKELGLIDELGYIEDAYRSLRSAVPGGDSLAVVRYKHRKGWMEMVELLDASISRLSGFLGSGLIKAGPMYILDY